MDFSPEILTEISPILTTLMCVANLTFYYQLSCVLCWWHVVQSCYEQQSKCDPI